MTDESAFQSALDELAGMLWPTTGRADRTPDLLDRFAGVCVVFADWLEEQGDWRAVGYRWLHQHRKAPRRGAGTWDWWCFGSSPATPEDLPDVVWECMPGKPDAVLPKCKAYDTRRDAEWALCKAIQSLQANS